MATDVLVWLVNEWGSVPHAAAGEDQAPYPDANLAQALLAGSGVPGCPPELLTDPALTRFADRLHPVFAAPDSAQRVTLVDALLAATGVRPALAPAAETWRVDDPRRALAAAAGLTLRHLLGQPGPDRAGVCSGRDCADAYLDASPAGRRRYCSVTCQNRARVAAWRRRR